MDGKRTYYEVLGVSRDARQEDIKQKYRRISLDNHPDRHPGDPDKEAIFRKAAEAHEVLSDPEKRKSYDNAPFRDSAKTVSSAPDLWDLAFAGLGGIVKKVFRK